MKNEEIAALQSQVDAKRAELGGGESSNTSNPTENGRRDSISTRIANYSELALEEEFSQQLYTTTLAGLEKARMEANEKQMYLATFIYPTLSEKAQYPSRFLISIAAFFLLLGLWAVGVLLYYNARDRS
jgi:capsular polysaccharide transport system permease protein